MARVLIVDDDEGDRLLESAILESGGHQLYFAKSGEQALKAFLRQSIDVVVTDLHMPYGDGMELIEAITGMYPDVPIIAVSGTGIENLSTAETLGARAALPKPVDAKALLEAVAAALKKDG